MGHQGDELDSTVAWREGGLLCNACWDAEENAAALLEQLRGGVRAALVTLDSVIAALQEDPPAIDQAVVLAGDAHDYLTGSKEPIDRSADGVRRPDRATLRPRRPRDVAG